MNECWEEGGLRAYFDRELPPHELLRAAAHLGACAACHARYNEIGSRAVRVSSLLAGLDVAPAASVTPVLPAPRRWMRPVAAAALLAAAAATYAFVVIPKRETAAPIEHPARVPHVERVNRPIQAQTSSPEKSQPVTRAKAERAKPRQPRPAATGDFLALDDDPIDMGVVMRVALDKSATVQADVIFDEQGRARAIREVKTSK